MTLDPSLFQATTRASARLAIPSTTLVMPMLKIYTSHAFEETPGPS